MNGMYVCMNEKKKHISIIVIYSIAKGSLNSIADEFDWLQLYQNASLNYFGRLFSFILMNGVGS